MKISTEHVTQKRFRISVWKKDNGKGRMTRKKLAFAYRPYHVECIRKNFHFGKCKKNNENKSWR